MGGWVLQTVLTPSASGTVTAAFASTSDLRFSDLGSGSFYFLSFPLHSTHTVRSFENLALSFSTKDPYKCSSHSALLHDGHTPPFPALKKILHLSHCQLNVDWRRNGGTYTIARV
jgi:hypothetical protein